MFSLKSSCERFFALSQNRTNLRVEIIGGLTTFMTMSYIIFVNPALLSKAGIPFEATVTATAWSAGLVTLLMGLVTNYPIALASGMGLNAALTYNVVLGMNVPWQTGMGIIVVEGLLVTALVLTNIREKAMDAIPFSLKRAIGSGIGLFIAFIGLKDAGFIVSHPATFVTIGNFKEPAVWLSVLGLMISVALLLKKVRGALLFGMLITAGIAFVCQLFNKPAHFISLPAFPSTFFQCDIRSALTWSLAPLIFSFFMMDFFDTMGTTIALAEQGGFLTQEGKIPRLQRVLLVDSFGAVLGGLFSASSVTAYIESASGIAEGARTGLSSIVVAACFFMAPFFAPLIQMIGAGVPTNMGILNPVTAPALILVGFLMMRLIADIRWSELEEGFPSFVTLVGMPLTFSISHGIGFGFISYTLIKLFQKKATEVSFLMVASSILFAISFVLG